MPQKPTNQSNCNTCEHNGYDEGWCYMFQYEPKTICKQHTLSYIPFIKSLLGVDNVLQ